MEVSILLDSPHVRDRRWLKLSIGLAITLVIAIILLARYFPYSEKDITEALHETLPGILTVSHFKAVYFPHPGCEVEGLTFRSNSSEPSSATLVTIRRLSVLGSYTDVVLRPHYIARLVLDGLHIELPRVDQARSSGRASWNSKITIGQVVAAGATIQIARADDKPPLRFEVHEVILGSVGTKQALSYRVDMQNPEPTGEIRSEGSFGPFNSQNPGQTPFAKLVDPFVNKNRGSVVPVVMNGSYDRPHFGLDLNPAH